MRAVSIDRGGDGALMDSVPLIGADLVHAQGFDGRGVTVAVLDSGIDANESRFRGPHRRRSDVSATTWTAAAAARTARPRRAAAARPTTTTDTARTSAASWPASGATAPRGIAPGARIVAVKVLDINRAFRSFTQIFRALEWIADERPDVKVINMSLGSWSVFTPAACESAAIAIGMRDVVAELRSRGVLITASSGNQSSVVGTTLPACMARRPRHRRDVRRAATRSRRVNSRRPIATT